MLRAEQADVVLAVSPLTDVEDLSVTELASFRDVFVAGPRFKSLAIGILPSLFAQSLLAQEGFFALDTEPIPARQILLVHRGEGRTSLLCILTSSKRKKPCHIKALQMRRTPLFGKNARKTEFISLPQPHHTLHQQTDGGDARPAQRRWKAWRCIHRRSGWRILRPRSLSGILRSISGNTSWQ